MAIVGDLKAVVLREQGVLLVAPRLVESLSGFFIVHIGDAFEKEERKDVRLEIGSVDRST
jgi:hypothetical protein